MKCILSSDNYGICYCHWDGYYIGKTYIYQGEPYANLYVPVENRR